MLTRLSTNNAKASQLSLLIKGKTRMRIQKHLTVLAAVSMLTLSVACKDKYAEGFNAGKEQGYKTGYDDGYDDGDVDGYNRGYGEAKAFFASSDYNRGFNDGKAQGITIGYSQGYNVGKVDGTNQGYTNGKNDGYNQGYTKGKSDGYGLGYDDGYDDGYVDGKVDGANPAAITAAYNNGYNVGYDDGYDDGWVDGDANGYTDGYNVGYDDGEYDGYEAGFDDGYDVGFDDGWDAALSVGPSKKLAGTAQVLSVFHNDLVNYSKIAAPKATKRGISAGSRMIFEETSLTNKDLEGRAAAVEGYLVGEMGKQVSSKFSLSQARSVQIAKAANHFRKFSTKRALTSADTNAYASEIIGVDMSTLQNAYRSSAKGEISGLNSALEKAAAKNGTSAEHMGQLMVKMFL